jgi:hypothetical protein
MSKLDAFDQSKLDAFQQSKLDARAGGLVIVKETRLADLYLKDLTYRPTSPYVRYDSDGAASNYYGFSGVYYVIHRRYCAFTIPAGSAPGSVKLKIKLRCDINHNSNFEIQCYSSNTDFSPLNTADWGYLDNLEDSVLVSSVVTPGGGSAEHQFSVDAARVQAKAGSRMWFIIASKEDIDDIPPALVPPAKFVWLLNGATRNLD